MAAWDTNRRIEIIVEGDGGAPVFRVMVSADLMTVTRDCDDFTSSPAAAAGDFYVQTEFYSDDDRGRILAARTANTLFRANDGEIVELGLVAEELFWATEDARLDPRVHWFENDSGGAHQFDRSDAPRSPLSWDRDQRCWLVFAGRGTYRCLPRTEGEIYADTIAVNMPASASVDACVAELDWSVSVERIDR
jgi:hypothetical protein